MDIILNVKELRFKMGPDEPVVLKIKKKGIGTVTGADIIAPEGVTVLTPDIHLLTITDDVEFNAELLVAWGRGYVVAERNADNNMPADFIPVDACFSPVEKVSFIIEKTFVGQSADYERLILEIHTDGCVTPEDALAHAAKIMKDHLQIFINFDDSEETIEAKTPEKKSKLLNLLLKNVADLELSVRASNCLANAQINTIYELVTRTDEQMLRTKNLGRKSLNEIKELLEQMNLSLYMTIDEETKAQYEEIMGKKKANGELVEENS